jgi:hypothetical protein
MLDKKVEKGMTGDEEKEKSKDEVNEELEKSKGKDEEEREDEKALDVLKDAYEKGIINKKEYEHATYKLLKSEVEGTKERGDGFLVGEIKIIERGGIPEIILERGELEIPTSAKLIKKGKEILVRVGNGLIKGSDGEEPAIEINEIEPMQIPIEKEKKDNAEGAAEEGLETTPDLLFRNFDLEKEFEETDFDELRKVDDLGEVKEDIELIDLNRLKERISN